ncbi:MAG TPA: hypothetical protein VFK05_06495 [Polyangiaceae bacterium]|nr:hypothetical protein [Polyangiaceae bacterium]
MVFVEGCIVADPPQYQTPLRTRPVLDVYGAQPTATHALYVYTDTPTVQAPKFTVGVRSEDAGEPLRAVFFLDYQMPQRGTQRGEYKLVSKTIPASTYDNKDRVAEYTWTPMTTKGCHYLSLVVAHRSSFLESDEDHLDPRYADEDAAIVTWTIGLDPPIGGALENCPTADNPIVP